MSKKLLKLLLVIVMLAVLVSVVSATPPAQGQEGNWGEIIDLGEGRTPAGAVLGDDFVVAYEGIEVRRLSPNGEVNTFPSPGFGFMPSIDTKDNEIVVAFDTIGPEGGIRVVRWNDVAGSWDEVGDTIVGGDQPNVAIGPSGEVHLVYDISGIVYLLRESPEGWEGVDGSELGLSPPELNCAFPSLEVVSEPHIVWQEQTSNSVQIRMTYHTETGWINTEVTLPDSRLDRYPTMVNHEGIPCVFWVHWNRAVYGLCFQDDQWVELAGSATGAGVSGGIRAFEGTIGAVASEGDVFVAFKGWSQVEETTNIHLHHLDLAENTWMPWGDQPVSQGSYNWHPTVGVTGNSVWVAWTGTGSMPHVYARQWAPPPEPTATPTATATATPTATATSTPTSTPTATTTPTATPTSTPPPTPCKINNFKFDYRGSDPATWGWFELSSELAGDCQGLELTYTLWGGEFFQSTEAAWPPATEVGPSLVRWEEVSSGPHWALANLEDPLEGCALANAVLRDSEGNILDSAEAREPEGCLFRAYTPSILKNHPGGGGGIWPSPPPP